MSTSCTNHGHDDDDGDDDSDDDIDDIDRDKNSATSDHATTTTTASPVPLIANQRPDGSTTPLDDHRHHNPNHNEMDSSNKIHPEPIRLTIPLNALPAPTTSNVPTGGSTTDETGGRGTKASPVCRSTSADRFYFDLAMEWVATEMDGGHRAADYDCGWNMG